MASSSSTSSSTILCTSTQTRFHVDTANYRELDIAGVNITIVAGSNPDSSSSSSSKRKSKARSQGLEVLSSATLRLKAGRRYALIGRNGTGKTTLLKAIAEKLIPGMPEKSRIAILQQTGIDNGEQEFKPENPDSQMSTRQQVIEQANSKGLLEQEIAVLSDGINSTDPLAPVRAIRNLKHKRLKRHHFLLEKDAKLRSGARGKAARQTLVAFEKELTASQAFVDQPADEIAPEALQEETLEATDLLADLQAQIEPSRASELEAKAVRILTGLGFTATTMEKPLASLSGGWRMRARLAAVLLQDADILILDEPTNFLDLLGIIWLQRYLMSLSQASSTLSSSEPLEPDVDANPRAPTLILVSHDRDFISLCTDLIILRDKDLTYYHGDLPSFEASKRERREWLLQMKQAQDKQKVAIQRTIANNLKEGRRNDDQNKIRQAKSRQKKLDDRWGMQVNAQGHRFRLNDQAGFFLTSHPEIEVEDQQPPVVISLPPPLSDLRFPGSLLSLEGASFRYNLSSRAAGAGAAPTVIKNVTITVGMGDRIGILGLNGAGKSTLAGLLTGKTSPTSTTATAGAGPAGAGPAGGGAQQHPRLRLGCYAQHSVEELRAQGRDNPSLTALSLLTADDGHQLTEGELRALLAGLGLPSRFASDVPISGLSGGQLVRCALARLLALRPHCLVLDEITTHLDYETVVGLRDALRRWEGAVVLISHDRWFMRGVVEGVTDEDEDDEEQRGVEEGTRSPRTRIVYKLEAGKLTVLKNGVSEFEQVVEKRVKKLLAA